MRSASAAPPTGDGPPAPSRRLLLGLLLLSAAGLTFEINLTRLFSVSQFYHFAFMIVSIALLGYGASGTLLAIFPRLGRSRPERSVRMLAAATALSILGAYLLTNQLPFDSFSIAWDVKQVWILVLHYVTLALPFFFSGMAIGLLLAAYPQRSGQTYAVNLLGAALGCLLALLAPSGLGGEGTVVLSSGLAALAGLAAPVKLAAPPASGARRRSLGITVLLSGLVLLAVGALGWRLSSGREIPGLGLHLSPYKSLSYALQFPGAAVTYQRWNAFSRVDVVRSPSIHSFPGLSYRYLKALPGQGGLTLDGDDLMPLLAPGQDLEFTGYLPTALPFRLRPGAQAAVIEPGGGLDLLVALGQGARQVTAVVMNPLIVAAAGEVYQDGRVQLEIESGRSYLRRSRERFDVIVFSLTSSYHPVRSGAYSLGEDFRYTVEAFEDGLARLRPEGLLVTTRWLQTPPSESLRTFALAVTAVEHAGGDPRTQIVALRGYNTATILVKNSAFRAAELAEIRAFAAERAFDLIYAPGIQPEETNRYNILPESIYYQAFSGLLEAQPRAAFYAGYAFDVTPPTDDHPFFGHFFKWAQAGQVLAELGKTWQPFGGAGYFVVLALLLLAGVMAGVLILLPAAVWGRRRVGGRGVGIERPRLIYMAYFGLIGLGFMLVEIPLIQRFILFLGHPTYALAAVLFTLLVFSALGSSAAGGGRLPLPLALGALVLLLLAAPWLLPAIFGVTLGLPLAGRLAVTLLVIAPLGFLMGMPFPGGIRWMLAGSPGAAGGPGAAGSPGEGGQPGAAGIPWIWAVNGAASVVSAVLAALLALSFGLDWVLAGGALCYAAAWLALRARVNPG